MVELARALGWRNPPGDLSLQQVSDWWQGRARRASRSLWRSPLYRSRKPLPGGGQAHFSYERSLWPVPLEKPMASCWETEACLFRNRNAAWAAVLVALHDLLGRTMQVRCWQVGQEVRPVLEALAGDSWSQAFRYETLLSSLEARRGDVFLLGSGGLKDSRGSGVVVMDLSGDPDFPVEDFLVNTECWLVVTLRQWTPRYGLFLSRPALVQLYARPEPQATLSTLATASEVLRRTRSVIGGAPGFEQLWEWSLPDLPLRPGQEAGPPPQRPVRSWPPSEDRQATLRTADGGVPLALGELKQRLLAYDEVPEGWELRPLLFSSAMAALAALSLAYPQGESGARYFETQFLRQLLRSQGPGVLWESVQYDWELTPWDLQLAQCPPWLIVDTTLTGQRLRLADILRHYRPLLAVRVFSALKLDQRGHELDNAGAVLLAGLPDEVERAASRLCGLREALGTVPNTRRLSPPWVLSPGDGHAEAVLENNRWLATQLQCGGLLRRVVHPSLGPLREVPWAAAPFVVLEGEDPAWISAALTREARGLPLAQGASFGFVHHRFESIVPVLKENRVLFKVAMGSSPDREGVLAALQRVYAHPDLASLKRAYPGLRRLPAVRDWASPSQRLLNYLEGSD